MTTLMRADEVIAANQTATQLTAPNFDRLARVYRWMEAFSFGPWLWRCRCAFLNQMTGAQRALVLGDGDGRFTARLLRENQAVVVDAVDCSGAMLNELLKRAGDHAVRVQCQLADVRMWMPAYVADIQCYDLVVTHFFLDCLTTVEVEALATRLRGVIRENTTWVISEFAIPNGWSGRWMARSLVSLLYRAFGWMTGLKIRTLPDHVSALRQAGFRMTERRRWLGGLLVSEAWVVVEQIG